MGTCLAAFLTALVAVILASVDPEPVSDPQPAVPVVADTSDQPSDPDEVVASAEPAPR